MMSCMILLHSIMKHNDQLFINKAICIHQSLRRLLNDVWIVHIAGYWSWIFSGDDACDAVIWLLITNVCTDHVRSWH